MSASSSTATPGQIVANTTFGLSWWWLVGPTVPGCAVDWPSALLPVETGGSDESGSGAMPPLVADARARILGPGEPVMVGGCLVALGALLIAMGAALIRLSARRERRRSAHRQKGYLLQPLWMLGIALVALGHAATFVAFSFASPWLVSTLGLSALLWNALLSYALNGEPLTKLGALSLCTPLLL